MVVKSCVMLSNALPCVSISLGGERRQRIKEFLQNINALKVYHLNGVNGQKLLNNGCGRAKHLKNGIVRMSWTGDGGKCFTRHCRMGKQFLLGNTDVWGMLGCTQSHEQAIQVGAKLARRYKERYFCVFEDDCSMPHDSALFWPVLTQALKHSPELLLLQLGWQTAGVAPQTQRKCVKRLRHGFGLHLAERQALAHAYVCHVDAVPELWLQEKKGWKINGYCDVDNFLCFLGGNAMQQHVSQEGLQYIMGTDWI